MLLAVISGRSCCLLLILSHGNCSFTGQRCSLSNAAQQMKCAVCLYGAGIFLFVNDLLGVFGHLDPIIHNDFTHRHLRCRSGDVPGIKVEHRRVFFR